MALPALAADAAAAQVFRGRVTAVTPLRVDGPGSITVKPGNADGKTFQVTAATTVTLDGQPATFSQVLADKQEATVASEDGTSATRIEARTRRAR